MDVGVFVGGGVPKRVHISKMRGESGESARMTRVYEMEPCDNIARTCVANKRAKEMDGPRDGRAGTHIRLLWLSGFSKGALSLVKARPKVLPRTCDKTSFSEHFQLLPQLYGSLVCSRATRGGRMT